MVVVAHRPIGIEAVDQLLVLKDGRMQAFGPKETVLGQVLQRERRRRRSRSCPKRSRENLETAELTSAPLDTRASHRSARADAGARRRRRRLGLDRADFGRADRAGLGGRRFQRQEGAAPDRRRGRRGRVRDGDIVKAGDVVVRLDETVVKASLAIVVKTLNGLWARAARLEAEQRGLDKIKFPPQLTDRADDPDVRDVWRARRKLFEVRVFGRAGQKSQLRERVSQLNEEIAGLTAQEQAKEKEVALVEKELDRRAPALRAAPDPDLAPDRAGARSRPAVGRARAIHRRAAQARGKITETELQIIQVDKDVVSEVSKELRETNDKIGEFVERKVTAEDQLRRIDIRAPQDGVVLQSTVHTVGGVITAGDAIMMVVPRADDLSVEAKVNPQDIDKLQIGQKTLLRLSAFNQRTTPELNGVVTRLRRRHHRPAHRPELLHHPRLAAAGRSRPPRRQRQDHPGHAGGSLRPDRRPHHVLLFDEAVQRPADALVPGAVRWWGMRDRGHILRDAASRLLTIRGIVSQRVRV